MDKGVVMQLHINHHITASFSIISSTRMLLSKASHQRRLPPLSVTPSAWPGGSLQLWHLIACSIELTVMSNQWQSKRLPNPFRNYSPCIHGPVDHTPPTQKNVEKQSPANLFKNEPRIIGKIILSRQCHTLWRKSHATPTKVSPD